MYVLIYLFIHLYIFLITYPYRYLVRYFICGRHKRRFLHRVACFSIILIPCILQVIAIYPFFPAAHFERDITGIQPIHVTVEGAPLKFPIPLRARDQKRGESDRATTSNERMWDS